MWFSTTTFSNAIIMMFANTGPRDPPMLSPSICSCILLFKENSVFVKCPKSTFSTLFERTEEHAYPNKKKNDQSAIYEHLHTCTHYNHIWDLFNLNMNDVHRRKFDINAIRDNTIVLDKSNNWNELLFKEALMIKRHRPILNTGLEPQKNCNCFKPFSF